MDGLRAAIRNSSSSGPSSCSAPFGVVVQIPFVGNSTAECQPQLSTALREEAAVTDQVSAAFFFIGLRDQANFRRILDYILVSVQDEGHSENNA